MGIVDSFKGFMGFDNDKYDDEFMDEELLDEEEYDDELEERSNSRFARKGKVVPLNPNTGHGQASITIIKPRRYDDVAAIADVVKSRRPVIFDVANMEETGVATKIVDFMSGVVYGLNGSIKKVSAGIFVAAPEHMSIASEEIRQSARSSLNIEF